MEKQTLHIRMSEEQYGQVRALAEKEHRSISNMIEHITYEAVKKFEQARDKPQFFKP